MTCLARKRLAFVVTALLAVPLAQGQQTERSPVGASPEAARTAAEHFAAGDRAFRSGDFERAVAAFEAAMRAGSDGPAVRYNLGVSHYRLGDYAEAQQVFEALGRQFPEMRDLADYNVGLALTRLGRLDGASAAFARAATADDEQIAALALTMLARVQPEATVSRLAGWTRFLDFRLGHDDNVALIDAASLPAGQSTDSPFGEVLFFLGGPVGAASRWRLDATAFVVDYRDAGEYDQHGLFLETHHGRGVGSWRLLAGPRAGWSTLDGDAFEQYLGLAFDLSRPLGASARIGIELTHDEIREGAARFAFIEGERDELRVRLDRSLRLGRLSFDYRYERNDRIGAGVSSERNRYSLRYRRPFGSDWSGEISYEYRDSEYGRLDPARSERRHQAGILATKALRAGWRLNLQYRYADNASTDPVFAYARDRYAIGASKLFGAESVRGQSPF